MPIKIEAATRLQLTAAVKDPELKKIQANKAKVAKLVKKMFADQEGLDATPEPGWWIMESVAELCKIPHAADKINYVNGVQVIDYDWETYITFANTQDEELTIKF